MPDELIEDLCRIKDSIAREHGYDVAALVAHLRTRERMKGRRVVDLRAAREAAEHDTSGKTGEAGSGGPVATAPARGKSRLSGNPRGVERRSSRVTA